MSKRSSTLSDSLDEIRFHCDAEGRFEQVSLEWVQWIGLGIEDVSGKSWIAFVAAEHRGDAQAAWERGVTQKSTIEIDTLFCDRYGEDVSAKVRFLPCLDSLGELFGFAARLTPERSTEDPSRSADDAVAAMLAGLELLGHPVTVADAKGAVSGPGAASTKGGAGSTKGSAGSTEEGTPVERLFPEVEPWDATWSELAISESPLLVLSGDGEQEVRVAALSDDFGSVVRALVTRAPAAPQDRRHYYSSLEATGLLASRFAHDINNSLALVAGYADLLAGAVPAELAEDTEQLRQKIKDTAWMCDSLHLLADHGEPVRRAVSLERLLRRVLPLLRAAVGARMVVEVEVDGSLPEVELDPHRLELLLLNLAIETRKLERTGRLCLRACRSGGRVSLVVEVESLEADTLDLSVASPLARAAGLPCEVSELGVTLTLAAARQARSASPPKARGATDDSTARREGVRVLVAEDEKVTRDLISRRLRSAGYAVTVAADGEQALDLYEALENEVDIVVTDILMPNKDGVALARELKERSPDLKMLMISGQKSAAHRLLDREVLLVGTPVMQKPFSSETLVSEIHELLTRPADEAPVRDA